MSKEKRVEEFVARLDTSSDAVHSPFYLGYFECFNKAHYYEAHDVLEHLWLRDRANLFYKGLIQMAGGFVHLQKQSLRPCHPKDGKRLRPAAKLFGLAIANLSQYPAVHQSLDVTAAISLCQSQISALEVSGYKINPWQAERCPQISPL